MKFLFPMSSSEINPNNILFSIIFGNDPTDISIP